MDNYNDVAARWWADKCRTMRKDLNKKTPKKCDISSFEKLLARTIAETVEMNGYMTLSCDYSPNNILYDIAKKCHLDLDVFPTKVNMRISDSRVSVKEGYGEPFEIIFPDNY